MHDNDVLRKVLTVLKTIKDYLKLFIAYLGRFLIHIFCVFPVKRNRIMFISMEGKQYSCNPRYITEYLQINYPGKYEIIWTFVHPEKFSYLSERGITLCKYRSIRYYYYKLTSNVSVSNYYWGPELPSRKRQLEIQTWHGGGGGTKKASGDDKALEDNKAHYVRYMLDSKRYTLMMTSSKMSLKNTVRGAMKFEGSTIRGTPRNDILLNNNNKPEIRADVYSALGLEADEKFVLYAPTWRNDKNDVEPFRLDCRMLKQSLSDRFGGKWRVVVRLHHLTDRSVLGMYDEAIDATNYPDMQELLYASSAVVTDYSSFVWDYSFTYRPCFLYCADLEAYIAERDFYTPIDTWGFDVCKNNDELEAAILSFDEEKYIQRLKKRQEFCGSFEDGHATERVCRVIESHCFGNGEIPEDITLV